MAIIEVEKLGKVEIAGSSPTKEEAEGIYNWAFDKNIWIPFADKENYYTNLYNDALKKTGKEWSNNFRLFKH